MRKIIYILTLTLFGVVGCSDNYSLLDLDGNYPADNIVRIVTETGENMTKATDYNGASLGLYVQNSVESQSGYYFAEWTHSTGVWSPSETQFWSSPSQAVEVFAYAPYTSSTIDLDNYSSSVEQNQNGNPEASDFVIFKNSSFVPQTDLVNGELPIVFEHKLSKAVVNIDVLNGLPSVQSVKIIAKNNFTYNASTDAVTTTGSEIEITANKENENTFSVILPPQTLAAGSLVFKVTNVNGDEFTYTTESVSLNFEKGKMITFNFLLGADNIAVYDARVEWWSASENLGTIYSKYYVGALYPNPINPIGVIYELEADGKSGKIFSVDEYYGKWSKYLGTTGANASAIGESHLNMYKIGLKSNKYTAYPAFEWVYNKNVAIDRDFVYSDYNTAGCMVNVWYLPTIGDLEYINESLINAGESGFFGYDDEEIINVKQYYSSTESTESSSSFVLSSKLESGETLEVSKTGMNYAVSILSFAEGEEVPYPKTGKYTLGDYYPDIDNPSTAIGVVCHVENDSDNDGFSDQALVMSFDEKAEAVWWVKSYNGLGFEREVTQNTDNGLANMRVLQNREEKYGDYLAYEWVNSLNISDGITIDYSDSSIGVWYLPAYYEYSSIAKNWVASLQMRTRLPLDGAYWSSTCNAYWSNIVLGYKFNRDTGTTEHLNNTGMDIEYDKLNKTRAVMRVKSN